MEFEFTADQLALRDAARQVLADACPPSLVRGVYEATGDGAALWQTLRALDWPGLAIAEADGGVGLGAVELGIVVEELGRAVAPTPLLATATQFVPAVHAAGSSFALPDVAAGRVTGALVVGPHAERAGDGWRITGRADHVLDGATADELAVVVRGPGGPGLVVVERGQVAATPVTVVDPTMPLATVVLEGVEVVGDRVLAAPGDPAAAEAIARALDAATAAMALSTVATCRAIFEQTVEYAKVREQFDRPIGSFQAVKHRLADAYLAVERAFALAWFAQLTIAEDDDRRPVAVAMAKAAAGDCQALLTRDGLQLHGGIGFTWEHDLHFWLKRAATGERLCGTAAHHRARLADLLGLAA